MGHCLSHFEFSRREKQGSGVAHLTKRALIVVVLIGRPGRTMEKFLAKRAGCLTQQERTPNTHGEE